MGAGCLPESGEVALAPEGLTDIPPCRVGRLSKKELFRQTERTDTVSVRFFLLIKTLKYDIIPLDNKRAGLNRQ